MVSNHFVELIAVIVQHNGGSFVATHTTFPFEYCSPICFSAIANLTCSTNAAIKFYEGLQDIIVNLCIFRKLITKHGDTHQVSKNAIHL